MLQLCDEAQSMRRTPKIRATEEERIARQSVRVVRMTVVPSAMVTQTSVSGEEVMVTAAGGVKVLIRRHVAQPPGRCPFLCHEVRRIDAAAHTVGSAG